MIDPTNAFILILISIFYAKLALEDSGFTEERKANFLIEAQLAAKNISLSSNEEIIFSRLLTLIQF